MTASRVAAACGRAVLCLVVIVASTEAAQATSRLTLAEARARALEHNPDLLAARSDVAQSQASAQSARELPNPSLAVSVGRIPTDGNPAATRFGNGLLDRSYESAATVSQLVELGGKRRFRRGAAAAGLEASSARLEDTRRTLDAEVVKSYASAALAEEQAVTLRKSAASLRESATIAQARFTAGDASLAETQQVELAAERFETGASAAEASAVAARIALAVVLGEEQPETGLQPADTLAVLAELSEKIAPAEPATLRPDVRAAELLVEKAESDLSLQRAAPVPDLTLAAGYDREPPDQRNTALVGVSFNVPLWNRNAGGIALAKEVRDQAKRERTRVARRAAAELAAAQTQFASASARWRRYRTELLPKAVAVSDSVAYAYQKGAASLLALLEAERSANDVRLEALQAAADAVSTAADLAAASNTRFPEAP